MLEAVRRIVEADVGDSPAEVRPDFSCLFTAARVEAATRRTMHVRRAIAAERTLLRPGQPTILPAIAVEQWTEQWQRPPPGSALLCQCQWRVPHRMPLPPDGTPPPARLPDIPEPAADSRRDSERIAAEESLRISEATFQGIVAIAADAIVTVDEEHRITLFNSGAEIIFGYAPEEVLGQPLEILIPERFRANHRRQVEEFARGPIAARRMGERREIYGRRKGGALFPAEASISKIEVAGRRFFTAVLRDVTDRQAAEQERTRLLEAERAARELAESAERRASFLAEAGEILNASLDHQETLGALARLVVPRLAAFVAVDVLDDDDNLRRLDVVHADPAKAALAHAFIDFPLDRAKPYLTRRALESGRSELVADVTGATLEEWSQGARHLDMLRGLDLRSFMSVPLIAHGRTLGAFAMGRTATSSVFTTADLALAEELARRASLAVDNARLYRQAQRATRLRDEVLGIVSHDLRNPLSVISMCASTLDELPPPDAAARAHELAETILTSSEWMQRMIQDLLDVGSIEAGRLALERSTEDFFVLIHQVLAMFERAARDKSIRLHAELPEDLPRVHADGERILQVLGNLIGNAVKFVSPGGAITVTATAREAVVEVAVNDSGPGIPPDELPRIFDRFWHARRAATTRGTGLGLTIAKGIVEAHGGSMRAESTLAVGSTFTFTIPLAAAPGGPANGRGAAGRSSIPAR